MSWIPIKEIKVGLDFGTTSFAVGRLAEREGRIYFEYDAAFIKRGLELSPLRLRLQPGLREFDRSLFEGLPGLFNDSLPDGWGRLLLDRALRAGGVQPDQVTPLDRLAVVGRTALGALTYEPDKTTRPDDAITLDLDTLATQTRHVLEGKAGEVLNDLIALNGSSAGARPKALIGVGANKAKLIHGKNALPDGFRPWIVKFANAQDSDDAGAIEYVYSLMARSAGVPMTDTHLFPAAQGAGYFATARFDREGTKRIHTHTACGLLHSDYRTPALDYQDLLALTEQLTRDVREVEKMFQLAVFNVLAHNRDDHSKNFTFLMDEAGEWTLSPAYDLTFSSGPGGEQSTMVMGEGKAPSLSHLTKLGEHAKLGRARIAEIIEQTQASLSEWKNLADAHGIAKSNIKLIEGRIT